MKTINVWDLPTRALHWTLAGSIILALIIIGDSGPLYTIHAICGVIALLLVLFRLVWGLSAASMPASPRLSLAGLPCGSIRCSFCGCHRRLIPAITRSAVGRF